MSGKILVVEDDVAMAQLLEEGLGRRGFTVKAFHSAADALASMAHAEFDAVVTDLNMKGLDGLQLCERIVSGYPGTPVVVVTAFGSMDTAIRAMRAGAYDFITKPFELEALSLTLVRAVQHKNLKEEVKRLRDEIGTAKGLSTLVGESTAMKEVRALLTRIADSDTSVLISGESGTGKEVVARAIHEQSRRRAGPFVAINCAAMPEALLESELFGHSKGAFTDARATRAGLFTRAQGGTLFLDEIGEMPIGLQPKLLRALQERKIRPVGSDEEVAFDARIISATNRDLESAIEDKRFREDLYFRINVINVHLPPLRVRGNDVLQLAQSFVRQFAEKSGKRVSGLSSPAAERLLGYSWPGNVRELQNVVERAVALTTFEQITVEDLPEKVRTPRPGETIMASEEALIPLDEVERRHILRVLGAVGGHRTQAAKILGLDRKTLYRKLERYGPEQVQSALGSNA
jgi:DNA-binding NtrC family response regulator